MRYFKKWWKYYFFCTMMSLSFNLYFIFLMQNKNVKYLLYLDFLLGVSALFFVVIDYSLYKKKETEIESLLNGKDLICQQIPMFENKDIAEHDVRILQERLQEKFEENCELQDYVAKWCHEFKIPLAASLLMDEKIKDADLRKTMREQLERMNQQINSMLLGCKLQSPLFDLQIKSVALQECVKTSIRNNQFFLIQKGFVLEVQVGDLRVHTDPAWLIYILDQLINNAFKYAGNEPQLHIWTKKAENTVELFIEDQGEGIKDNDIRRIFEKGFTGSNNHNGKYKSTGMGLYMVSKIVRRLGHEIHVESEYGKYTRFWIEFMENSYFQF